jgi:small subunit ribosomal protein S6
MHKYAGKRFREYETVFILQPQINQSATDMITKKVEGMIAQYEGKLTKVSLWGLRKLSYRIKRQGKGIYYQLNYVSPQGFVDEMEKYFKLNDNILRYLTVRMSEEPIDPSKVIVKSGDIEFGSVEGLSEMPVTEAAQPAELLAEESGEISEGTGDFADIEVEADEKEAGHKAGNGEQEEKGGKKGEEEAGDEDRHEDDD